MCGIAGAFAYASSAPAVDEGELVRMREHMARRGPDGEGLWISGDRRVGLAHRRLSIVDLSDTGAQPMSTPDGRLHIIFNGEIYNYRELRGVLLSRGNVFRSESDTEVLLHLYRECGPAMLPRLRGMFAFAIWDALEGTLLLARDPFGIKPLYYADDGSTFRFASQVKALLAGGHVDTSPEPAGHVGFFLWGHVPEPFTLYRGIRAIPAGAVLTTDLEGRKGVEPFFDLTRELSVGDGFAPPLPAAEAQEQLRSALLDSVRAHLVADVPVGVFLSAGLDSTTIAALANEAGGGELRTLTLGFEEFAGTSHDEVSLAETVAHSLGAHHHTHLIRREDFAGEFDRILDAMDQPSIDGANTYFVAKAAHEVGLKVALSGLGGDELFAGYSGFVEIPRLVRWAAPFARLPGLGRAFRLLTAPWIERFASPKWAGLFELGGDHGGAYLLRRGLFMPWELPKLLDAELVREGWRDLQTRRMLRQTMEGVEQNRLKVAALETAWYMRNQLLRDSDWAGMANSVEVRVPLVDAELFRAVVRLVKSGFVPSKRDMAAAPTWPLAEAIRTRPKTGFSVPIREWLLASRFKDVRPAPRGLRGWAEVVYQYFSRIRGDPCQPAARRLGRLDGLTWNKRLRLRVVKSIYAGTNAALFGVRRVLWPVRPAKAPQRICLFRIGNVGDTICSLPAMLAVRRAYPAARLVLVTSPGDTDKVGAQEVLPGNSWLDGLIVYHDLDIVTWHGRWRLLRQLQRERFDLWIELPNGRAPLWMLLRNMLFARLSGARWGGGWRLSTVRLWPQLQSDHLYFPNEVARLLEVMREEGVPADQVEYDLAKSAEADAAAATILRGVGIANGESLVAMAPGSKRPTNYWFLERWIDVGRNLNARGYKVLLVGSTNEVKLCGTITERIGSGAENLAGRTSLPVLAALLRHCAFVLCVDSGIQHMAAAVGTRCLSLMAARDYEGKWHPHGNHIVIEKRVQCHTCLLERCPHENLCMREISVKEVLAACDQVILDCRPTSPRLRMVSSETASGGRAR